ncbi:MAG: hypothetical protein OXK74_10325 [Gemmatimonadota bacterium]|nr:hypothetical protein [Gemmatimonadota bacterium]
MKGNPMIPLTQGHNHRVDEGEKAWLTSDLEALAAPVNEQFRHRNTVVEDALEKWLASRQPSPFILAEAIAGINEMLDPGGQDSNTPAPDRIQYTTAPQVTVKTALQHLGFSPPTKTSKYKGASKRWWCFPDHWPVRDGG